LWAGVLVVTRLLLLWHSANRATRAFQVDSSSATVCPFHLQDGRFTASKLAHSTSQMSHRQVQLDVSFLLRCQGSRPVPCGTAILRVGGVSSSPQIGSSKATHQLASPKAIANPQPINILMNRQKTSIYKGGGSSQRTLSFFRLNF